MNEIEQLCPNCGMCCDSTLFADVELRQGDDPRRLAKAGLNIFQKTRAKRAFEQSCACFDGKFCTIYAERPTRCRLFKCGVLKRVERGEMTASAALKKIAEAKSRAENVRRLLRQSGQRDEQMALTHRYADAMKAPVSMSDAEGVERQGELMMAVNDLMQMLEREFLR